MAPRFKGLTQSEIERLMNNFDSEYYADSDSDCEIDNSVIDESSNGVIDNENQERVFQWKVGEDQDSVNILPFKGIPGLKVDLDGQDPYDYFKLIFENKVIELICEETNKYAEQVLELRPDDSGKRKHSPEWKNTTPCELEKFLGIILLMGHIDKDKLQDYWSTNELIETPIFGKIMSRDRFFMILKFLHFSNNDEKPSKESLEYDRLWKIRKLFEILKETFKRIYEPEEELSLDEVIIKFKGRVAFRQYIPKKRKQWGIKLYKINDKTGYTYDMRVYLGKDKTENYSASYNVVNSMTDCVKEKGHKLFMDNFFSSPELFYDLLNKKQINACGTVRSNRKNFPKDITQEKIKRGEIRTRYGQGLTALRWKDKRDVYMLSSMHHPSMQKISESNEQKKPPIVADYNKHMGYVDLSDRMANTYSFQRKTVKWTKKLFFHLFDLSVLNAYILSKFSGCQRDFRLSLVKNLIKRSALESPRVAPSTSTIGHWPLNEKKRRRCVVCYKNGLQRRSTVICKECDVALCIDRNCFAEYHTASSFKKTKLF